MRLDGVYVEFLGTLLVAVVADVVAAAVAYRFWIVVTTTLLDTCFVALAMRRVLLLIHSIRV